MTIKNALKLHSNDRVVVNKTKEVLSITEVEFVPKNLTANGIAGFSVLLSNGVWYGYKEISQSVSKE